MPNPTLVFLRLEGPLQSWGMRARWDVRDSHDEPTKSAIVGLIGSALGYKRGDQRLETNLDANLSIGVRVENAGQAMIDFHTVSGTHLAADGKYCKPAGGTSKSVPAEPTTIVSRRTYIQDAAFLVVIAGPPELLKLCHQALLKPAYPLFLGRRSCPPSRPVFEAHVDCYTDTEDALRKTPWSCQWMEMKGLKPSGNLRCTIEDPSGTATRQDAFRVNPARMYGTRQVRVLTVDAPILEEES